MIFTIQTDDNIAGLDITNALSLAGVKHTIISKQHTASESEQTKTERDAFKSIVEEVMEALEKHKLHKTLEAVKKDYQDTLNGKYEGKGT